MSKRYPGNFITGNPVALSQTSNNGVWDMKDVSTAVGNGTWQEADGIYEIGKSLRFRRSAAPYLSRTPAVAGNRTTWTWSGWVKFGSQSQYSDFGLFHAGSSDVNRAAFYWDLANGQLHWGYRNSSSWVYYIDTVATFRDPCAWYHVMCVFDTTNTDATQRNRIYVNGVRQAVVGTGTAAQNATSQINNTDVHSVGTNYYYASATNLDGNMAEVNFVDGQALDPSYFGYTDSITNIWQPKKYTGSYGVNGFYLPFTDTYDVQSLGRDYAYPNWFSFSQVPNNSYWVYPYGITDVVANYTTAPDGSNTAFFVRENSATDQRHWRTNNVQAVANTWFTFSIYAKSAGNGRDYVQLYCDANGSDSVYNPTYNLANGTVGNVTPTVGGSATAGTSTITAVGNGWYRLTMSGKLTNAGSYRVGPYFSNSAGAGNASYTGGGTGYGMYFWGSMMNYGTTALPYNAQAQQNYGSQNSYTPVNFSLTAGASYDSSVDSPTNVFTTATDTGGVVPGNYCVLNTYNKSSSQAVTNGSLDVTASANSWNTTRGTIAVSTGKWYWEVKCTGSGGTSMIGIDDNSYNIIGNPSSSYTGAFSNSWSIYTSDGNRRFNTGSGTAYIGSGAANGDTIMVALDMDNSKIWWGKNGTWAASGDPAAGTNAGYTNLSGYTVVPSVSCFSTSENLQFNFGQRAFTYTPPVGFKSLNTTNLQALGTGTVGKAAIQPHKWFDATAYVGLGGLQQVKNSGGFQPDLVWVKSRSNATYDHMWVDSARGAGNILISNATSSEQSANGYWITGFDSDGFTLGQAGANGTNASGSSYVGWQWKQSPTSGFNIITYTGTGVARTISHNLGVKPSMIITKRRDATGAGSTAWGMYHAGLGATKGIWLNESSAASNNTAWNNTEPTSSVFSVGTTSEQNGSGTAIVAYLWAEVPGFSKFGSYYGNASTDGVFVYCGFRPRYILIKRTDGITDWHIHDTARTVPTNNGNPSTYILLPDTAGAEITASAFSFDILSNGFKLRTTDGSTNANGSLHIFAAFAESPFALNNRAR